MKVSKGLLSLALGIALMLPMMVKAVPVTPTLPNEGNKDGWGQINRMMDIANLWDQFTNRHYGGHGNALTWPGAWALNNNDERRSHANYKGFVIGATNVKDPQYHDVVWPYMVGQRDGLNDGEQGIAVLDAAPDPAATSAETHIAQTIYKGRMLKRTFRQYYPDVTVNGVELMASERHLPESITRGVPEIPGDTLDSDWQSDIIDATHIADLSFTTHSWSRMGISTQRRVYSFVDRNNDDVYFWHWRMVNDGLWGRFGVDLVDSEGPWPEVTGVMQGFMFQWDRSSVGAIRTASSGQGANDTIWNYYGVDYDGAKTENMRLVWVRDGDQDDTVFAAYSNGSTDDTGDPDPTTGELLTYRNGGLQFLHMDVSATDKNDDPGQPRTVGWEQYEEIIRTGPDGHEAKYNQMLLGIDRAGEPYPGLYDDTPARGAHPNGGSWIKASNDPATSDDFWPDQVLGISPDVTDCEQQSGYGPVTLAAYDTVNIIVAVGVNGLNTQYAQQVGRDWMTGAITDAQKNDIMATCKDSIFMSMRQAKAVYESATYDGGRYASTRSEFEATLQAAIDAGILSLSPPAPATFNAEDGKGHVALSWTLNTSTGSDIAGWNVYRATNNFKGDSAFTLVKTLGPGAAGYLDGDTEVGVSYYYYLTTFDAMGHESTMHTRTSEPVTRLVYDDVGVTEGTPAPFSLSQNAPNPFNPTTVIRYSIPTAGHVRLEIFSTSGQLVRTLVDGTAGVGAHTVTWNGTDAVGKEVASGTYIYRLASGDKVQVRRMMLVK